MLQSMTGYGRANRIYQSKNIHVEVRSLNSKFTDLRIKIPQNYKEKEPELRRLLTESLGRGKIELTIEIVSPQGEEAYALNLPLFKMYFRELSQLSDELKMEKDNLLSAILRLPNVVTNVREDLDEKEWQTVWECLEEALLRFNQFRKAEGEAMATDLKLRIESIQEAMSLLEPFEKERVSKLRQRLRQNLDDFMSRENVDENRFEQEIIFYLEKMDITEEKVRLAQHCLYFLEQLEGTHKAKGRKLNFISQEIGREINTLGAKAYSSDIQRLVVKMKDELEKIKELVANVV